MDARVRNGARRPGRRHAKPVKRQFNPDRLIIHNAHRAGQCRLIQTFNPEMRGDVFHSRIPSFAQKPSAIKMLGGSRQCCLRRRDLGALASHMNCREGAYLRNPDLNAAYRPCAGSGYRVEITRRPTSGAASDRGARPMERRCAIRGRRRAEPAPVRGRPGSNASRPAIAGKNRVVPYRWN